MRSKLTKKIAFYSQKTILAIQRMNSWEKWSMIFLLILILVAIVFKVRGCYLAQLPIKPDVGGVYREGVIGSPDLINPLLAENQAEKSLVKLTYQSVYQYNNQGELTAQIAKSLKPNKSRNQYQLVLKTGLKWSDNKPITAQDLVATIKMTKELDYQGPWQGSWQGIYVTAKNKKTVNFSLVRPNYSFKELLTMPVMPAHILKDIDPKKFSLNEINQQPVGSGPYQIDNIIYQDSGSQVLLIPNPNFPGEKPYISKLVIHCYSDYQQMIHGLKQGQISAVSYIYPKDYQEIKNPDLKLRTINLPQITAAFFNLKSKKLKSVAVRQALAWSINKPKLLKQILGKQGSMINSPLPLQVKKADYYPSKAKKIFKKNKPKLRLVTSIDPVQTAIAQEMASQWQKYGLKIEVTSLSSEEIGLMIQSNKDYDILLFGQNLGLPSDLFSFWHSTQISDGFNLSLLKSNGVDRILEQIDVTTNEKARLKLEKQAASLIKKSYPALFLFRANYLHLVPTDIKGIRTKIKASSPIDRFYNAESWYLKEKRVEK